jgi:hypothetical protein
VGLSTSRALRCPRCDAHVLADADWCTLCYADLRPAPQPEPEPEPQPEPGADEPEPVALAPGPAGDLAADAPVDVPPATGKHARRAGPAPEDGLEGVDVDAMLAQLAIESDSGLGPLAGRLQTKESKAIVIVGGIAVVCVVLFVLMAVLGALL